jgi:Inner membrane protein YgaP-like, transmembrane domain
MKKNVGSIDRLVRIILALVFAILIFNGTLTGAAAIIFGILGIVFLGTALLSVCPLYSIFKLSTAKKEGKTV